MITMMYIVGRIVRERGYITPEQLLPACAAAAHGGPPADACFYEAFARVTIFSKITGRGAGTAAAAAVPLASSASHGGPEAYMGFVLPRALWPSAAPTWNDTTSGFPGECLLPYRERVLQGEVSDGNAYALGGVSGHAGLFATAAQLHELVHQLLFAPLPADAHRPRDASGNAGATDAVAPGRLPLAITQPSDHSALGVNATTVLRFTTVHNASKSTRALGWDTSRGPGTGSLCGNLSAQTFMHTGYTGTLICADRGTRGGLITILLTNRVYPRADDRSERAIHNARQQFNNAVLEALA